MVKTRNCIKLRKFIKTFRLKALPLINGSRYESKVLDIAFIQYVITFMGCPSCKEWVRKTRNG